MQLYADSQRAFTERAKEALTECVPVLARALQAYFAFLSKQRALAEDKLSQQKRALHIHANYLDDDVPSKRYEMKKSIRELTAVRKRSTEAMLQVAETQRRLWEGRKGLLPSSVRELVTREYAALWRQLSGSVHEVHVICICADID